MKGTEWHRDAALDLVMNATEVELYARQLDTEPIDRTDVRRLTLDALEQYFTTLDSHAAGPDADRNADRFLFTAMVTACLTAYEQAPPGRFGDGTGPMTLVMEDTATGETVADPDAELADDPDQTPDDKDAGRGVLAALRFFTAVANRDNDTTHAVWSAMAHETTRDDGLAPSSFLVTLLEFCAGVLADVVEAQHTPSTQQPAPEPPRETTVHVDPVTGRQYANTAVTNIDPRDRHPDDVRLAAPHGDAEYGVTLFQYGTRGNRRQAVAAVLSAMRARAATTGTTLCGVDHDEDVQVDQLPHTGRRSARRALRDAARMRGGHWGLVRVWQHTGPCPDTATDAGAGPDDVPLFDLPDTAGGAG